MFFCNKKKLNNEIFEEAVNQGNYSLVEEMLKLGANPNYINDKGTPILITAAKSGHHFIVKLLLAKGAKTEIKDFDGTTAIRWAILRNHIKVVNMLLPHMNIEEKDERGGTNLVFAASIGNAAILSLLLQKGADINAKTNLGNSALAVAVVNNHMECIKLLLKKNPNLEDKNKLGYTALMWAAIRGHVDIAQLLLENGASQKNLKEFTPYCKLNLKVTIDFILKNFYESTYQKRLEKIHYQDEIPEHLMCPISYEIMNDPITLSSGITYDRFSLIKYFHTLENSKRFRCPITRKIIPIEEIDATTNVTINHLIDDFVTKQEQASRCKYKQAQITLFKPILKQIEKPLTIEEIREKRIQRLGKIG